MNDITRLKKDYPWIQTPLIVGAPMRLIALADMAVEISKAGGIGFIGAGTDVSDLDGHLSHATHLLSSSSTNLPCPPTSPTLPTGLGFINWGADLPAAIKLLAQYKPCAVWFFAPSSLDSLLDWTTQTRDVSPATKIWVQVGSVRDARDVVRRVRPDVLVVQGTDAGGHGLVRGAGLGCLVPEVVDAVEEMVGLEDGGGRESEKLGSEVVERPIILAAGGISEARGAAAALILGASGIVLGTRLLASPEANISQGYKKEILRASDGGQSTVRTKVYDNLRGTTGWAETHNARGVVNKSYFDAVGGMDHDENKRLYEEEMKVGDEGWGADRRMTTYAGSGVGLVKEIKPVGEIVREVREGARGLLEGARSNI